jgi:hypothetical protein
VRPAVVPLAVLVLAMTAVWSRGMGPEPAPPPAAPPIATPSAPAAAADAAARAPADDERVVELTRRVGLLEEKVRELASSVDQLRTAVAAAARPAAPAAAAAPQKVGELEKKLQELTQQYEAHSHDYLLEGRAANGSVQATRPEEFSGSGLTQTGSVRIGRSTPGR